MNEVSLFTGAGGGILGTKLLGWKTIGYVEWNGYCQQLIRQRIDDGILDEAPIFGDIKTFISSGCAELYEGCTDVLSAGFNCQPYSTAGKQKAGADERDMWPDTAECIRLIKPPLVWLENVPGLISTGYIFNVLDKLIELGYSVLPPLRLGAGDIGALHPRERIWILAYAFKVGCNIGESVREGIQREEQARNEVDTGNQNVSNTDKKANTREYKSKAVQELSSLSIIKNSRGIQEWRERQLLFEPKLLRSLHGIANGVDRIKSAGNMQVPRVVATAWRLLTS